MPITELVHRRNALVRVAQVQLAIEGHFKLLSLLRACLKAYHYLVDGATPEA